MSQLLRPTRRRLPRRATAAALAAATAATALLVAAPQGSAQAGERKYANYIDYRVSAGIGTHEVACEMTNAVDKPYGATGEDTGRSGSATSTFDLTVTDSGQRVASFRTTSSFRTAFVKRADRSLRGRAVFEGTAKVAPVASHLCDGIGETRLQYGKAVRVARGGEFRVRGVFDDFYHLSFDVYVYPATATGKPNLQREREVYSRSRFWEYDDTTKARYDRKIVRLGKRFKVRRGSFVLINVNTGVFAQSNWWSTTVDGKTEYTYTKENGDGGLRLRYAFRPRGT